MVLWSPPPKSSIWLRMCLIGSPSTAPMAQPMLSRILIFISCLAVGDMSS